MLSKNNNMILIKETDGHIYLYTRSFLGVMIIGCNDSEICKKHSCMKIQQKHCDLLNEQNDFQLHVNKIGNELIPINN